MAPQPMLTPFGLPGQGPIEMPPPMLGVPPPGIQGIQVISSMFPSIDGGANAQVLRNIPVQYTSSLLLEGLERHGFKGLLDLLYLPCDLTGRGGCNNVSSALLHFGTSIAAKKFADTFHNRYMMDLLPGFDLPGRILQVTAVSRTLKESIERLIGDSSRHLAEHPDDDDDDDDDDHC